jgi:dephospho-CoA kinase
MPSDYDFVKNYQDAQVLYITIDQKIRWGRIANRGEKSDDKISFEKFQELDRQETEKYIPEIGTKADKTIRNEKDLNYLLSEVDKYMNELGVPRKFEEVEEKHEIVGEIPDFEAQMKEAKKEK